MLFAPPGSYAASRDRRSVFPRSIASPSRTRRLPISRQLAYSSLLRNSRAAAKIPTRTLSGTARTERSTMAGLRMITRRTALRGGAAIGALAIVSAPSILQAQPKEIVIGGAASHKPWVESIVQPFFEKKYDCKIVYRG